MTISRRLSLIVAVCCLYGGGPMRQGAFAADLTPCEQAGVDAEQAAGLPPGLLLAIGRVESGRWDSGRGRTIAWPWTINAAGKGQWFETRDMAARTVRALLDGGTRSIDVGCFQINLMWHPAAFASLEEAFDPGLNARYAAAFLLSLYGRTGSWESAVESYHSADPTLGFAYRQQVFSTWLAAPRIAPPAPPGPMLAAARALPVPAIFGDVAVWTPLPAGAASGVVAVPGAAAAANPLPVVTYRPIPRGLISAR